jgi:recombinational DNA repair protein RecT
MPSSNDRQHLPAPARRQPDRQERAPAPRAQQRPDRRQAVEGRLPPAWNDLKAGIDRNRDVYAALLSKGTRRAPDSTVERFCMECYQAVWNRPELLDANRDSLLLAFAETAVVGLSLNPTLKEAFIEIRGGLARFGTQYQGLIKLMHRGGEVDFLFAEVVRRGDHFRQVGGSEPMIDHVAVALGYEPDDYDDDASILASYAVVRLKGSTRSSHEVARRKEILQAMAMSKGKGGKPPSSSWRDWFPRMAKKLPIRRLANTIPGADEAKMVLAIEDAQARGEPMTFDRVSQLLDPVSAPRVSVDAAPEDGAELSRLIASSGPASGDDAPDTGDPANKHGGE